MTCLFILKILQQLTSVFYITSLSHSPVQRITSIRSSSIIQLGARLVHRCSLSMIFRFRGVLLLGCGIIFIRSSCAFGLRWSLFLRMGNLASRRLCRIRWLRVLGVYLRLYGDFRLSFMFSLDDLSSSRWPIDKAFLQYHMAFHNLSTHYNFKRWIYARNSYKPSLSAQIISAESFYSQPRDNSHTPQTSQLAPRIDHLHHHSLHSIKDSSSLHHLVVVWDRSIFIES